MKKIGIVTIISENYGNRLQNFAMQEYLKMSGFIPETILKSSLKYNSFIAKNIIKKMFCRLFPKKNWRFGAFNTNIRWSRYNENTPDIAEKYDYFIAGSDQIWNPMFNFNSDREFLTFARPEQRIAYAASIGIDKIPPEYEADFIRRINGIDKISMREDAGAEIVKKYKGVVPPVLIDPTMLLSAKKWADIADKSVIKKEGRYVFLYFFNDIPDELQKYINKYAKDNNAEIVDIGIINHRKKKNKNVGPAEFLYLIRNSVCVFTNSFHGSVFSVLFNKEFFIFQREEKKDTGNMESRLITFVDKFCLQDRFINNPEDLNKPVRPINYKKVNALLKNERKKAHDFFADALK